MVNKASGKGYESTDFYSNIKFKFIGIENIHIMRNSLQKLIEGTLPYCVHLPFPVPTFTPGWGEESALPKDTNKWQASGSNPRPLDWKPVEHIYNCLTTLPITHLNNRLPLGACIYC